MCVAVAGGKGGVPGVAGNATAAARGGVTAAVAAEGGGGEGVTEGEATGQP